MLLLLFLVPAVLGQDLSFLGEIEAREAGFTALYEHPDPAEPSERYSIALSTFSTVPLTRDDLLWFEYPGKYLDDIPNMDSRVLLDNLTLPREPGQVPYEVFGHEALSQPDGFLAPGKTNGKVGIIDLRDWNNVEYTDISSQDGDRDWFFHRVLWRDADGDGDQDAFTCRAAFQGGVADSEFVYFENPGGDDPAREGPWGEVIISENDCDMMHAKANLEADGQVYDVTFTAGYFSDRLSVYWSTNPDGRWDDNDNVESRLIDESGIATPDDHFFDVEVVDLNLDGQLDLLVTINSATNGTMLAYEIPDDFRTGEYVQHVLASGFFSRVEHENGGAPGQAISFHPQTSMSDKPWILMSGDDEGTCYYYSPVSEDPDNWEYEETLFLDHGPLNIIGKPVVADFDGDGWSDIFVPLWTAGLLQGFSFAPSN